MGWRERESRLAVNDPARGESEEREIGQAERKLVGLTSDFLRGPQQEKRAKNELIARTKE